jgi:hypothetical protein
MVYSFISDLDLFSCLIVYFYCVHLIAFICLSAVILSKYLNIPLYNILDWHKFSILLEDVYLLKDSLRGIQAADFRRMKNNLHRVKFHSLH